MRKSVRGILLCLMGLVSFGQTACNMVPRQHLSQAQNRTRQLFEQNRSLAAESEMSQGASASLDAQLAQLREDMGQLQSQNRTGKQLLANSKREQSTLRNRYASLLDKSRSNPLSDESTRRFEDLARRFPDFEFDPQTGVSKFQDDVLFESGSADVRKGASPLLQEFSDILGSRDAQNLQVLVVGHTDDRRVAKSATRKKHPSNMHLSAHRAINVRKSLSQHGLKQSRIGIAGYAENQPLVPNRDAKSRQQNRRVEIYVLAPTAPIAGRRPDGQRR